MVNATQANTPISHPSPAMPMIASRSLRFGTNIASRNKPTPPTMQTFDSAVIVRFNRVRKTDGFGLGQEPNDLLDAPKVIRIRPDELMERKRSHCPILAH